MARSRKLDPSMTWRVAKNLLGRMACAFADPNDEGHDHAKECLIDDEAYAADLILRLVAAAVTGDDSVTLDRLTDLTDAHNSDGP